MEPSVEITKLCESWWECLSDSTRADHLDYAKRFLSLLGWGDTVAQEMTTKIEGASAPVSFVLRGGGQSAIATYFMLPGSLEPPTSIVERGLDFCTSTRRLVEGTRKSNINYAFVTDLFRSYLYDAFTDELLLYSDTPAAFNRDVANVLTKAGVERGALEEVRRAPRSSAARQLREWCHHWIEILNTETDVDEDTAFLAIDRLLVLAYLFEHDILKQSGWRLRSRYSELMSIAESPNPEGCGRSLTTLFHDIWFDWKAEMFHPSPKLDAALEDDALASQMLKEFALMSRNKFTIATILESFNYGDAAEKARIRLVPEIDLEREAYLGKQTLESVDSARITVDILDEGYRAIMHWFDKLVDTYANLGIQFESKGYCDEHGNAATDLFTWSEIDATRPGALKDYFQFALEEGMDILYVTGRQYRTARLLLYLHLISKYAESKHHFSQFPRVENALKKRPALTGSDKAWGRSAPNELKAWRNRT